MSNEIVFPKPKFGFHEIVLIQMTHTVSKYEDCPDCIAGQIIARSGKTMTCPTCHGSGHTYKATDTQTFKSIDGMLLINCARVELHNPRRETMWDFDGVTYMGHVVWKDDVKDKRSCNVFHENSLFRINEI